MTAQKDLKKLVRARMARTGEPYTTAREHVLRERDALGLAPTPSPTTPASPAIVEAIVLRTGPRSARVRVLGEVAQLTVRGTTIPLAIPGRVARLAIGKRWEHRSIPYASAELLDQRTDVARLGLEPLALTPQGLEDPAEHAALDESDPANVLWAEHTGRPRPSFEFDPIAWVRISRDVIARSAVT